MELYNKDGKIIKQVRIILFFLYMKRKNRDNDVRKKFSGNNDIDEKKKML